MSYKIDSKGNKYWYLNNEYHREDGPAIERFDGGKEWFINGKRHREDGPAVEYVDGDKEWWINDELHREDGPAIEYLPSVDWCNGYKSWHLNGEYINCKSNEDFIKIMKSRNYVLNNKNKIFVLRKIYNQNSGIENVYFKNDMLLSYGPNEANWTSQRSEALRFNDLKWAFTVAKLYGCKVYSFTKKTKKIYNSP